MTGARAFSGPTPADTISAILNREPADSIAGRTDMPPALARIVAHCLEKNRAERFQSARDVVFALTTLAGSTVGPSAVVSPSAARRWPIREAIAWTLAAGAIAAVVVVRRPTLPAADAVGAIRFAFAAPEGYVFQRPPPVPEVALSPDGRTPAFVAVSGTGSRSLWVRRLDATTSIRIANDALFPFWSPDGRYVGFNSRGRIWRVRPTERAEPESIVNADTSTGSWGPEGSILLSAVGAKGNIGRARVSTGQSETILQLRRDDLNALDPSWLPDGRHILFINAGRDESRNGVYVADLGGTSLPVRLLPAAIRAEYSCGHILTVRDGALMAYPFDLARFAVTGDPQKVTDGVGQNPPYASLAASGTCAVAFGSGYATTASQLSFVDRGGHWISDIGASSDHADLRLSPDGARIATKQYKSFDDQTTWIVDLNRQVSTKLTDRLQGFPVWWPDGRRLQVSTLATDPFTRGDLSAIATDGSGAADGLVGQQNIIATDMTSDGRLAVLTVHKRDNTYDLDLAVASLTGDPRVQPYLTTSANEYDGRLSPDGKWLAYVSNETGIDEVYVQSFPQPGHKYRVSTSGGTEPKWRRDGGELFYRSDRSLFAVAVHSREPDLQPAVPTEIMKGMNWALRGGRPQEFNWTYDVLPDGRRFVVNQYGGAAATVQVNVIVNWPALLK